MEPALARLDHVIIPVPSNISAIHNGLATFRAEAWPVGPFWPDALTSGIAMGGFNVELVQHPSGMRSADLVFEPTSLAVAENRLRELRIGYDRIEKVESDPQLLRLRGFTEAESATPQLICTNLVPQDADSLPFKFFLCEYSPFLKAWLSPDHPRFARLERVDRIECGTTGVTEARELLAYLGCAGGVGIDFVESKACGFLGLGTEPTRRQST